MRLIDADALKEHIKMYTSVFAKYDWREICEMLNDAPTVDAVEVVRCKDCKWWDEDENDPYGYCMAMKHGYISARWEIGIYRKYKGDFYCADGERSTDCGAKMDEDRDYEHAVEQLEHDMTFEPTYNPEDGSM